MNNSNKKTGEKLIDFAGLLTLIFITLKLLGEITWPWILVLSPIWGTSILFALGSIVYMAIVGDALD